MIQDIAVNINAEFESCGKCGRRMEGDDAVYYRHRRLRTKVRDLLLAIDHNLELMRTYSNPHQDMPATPAQYIAEELETVRSYINNEI